MAFSSFRRSLKKGGNTASCGVLGGVPDAVTEAVCVREKDDVHKLTDEVEYIAVLDDNRDMFNRQAIALEFSNTVREMIEAKRVVLMAITVANADLDARSFSSGTPGFGLARRGLLYQRIQVGTSGTKHFCLPEWYAYIRLVCSAAVFCEYFTCMGASYISSTNSEIGEAEAATTLQTDVTVDGVVGVGGTEAGSSSRRTNDNSAFTFENILLTARPHLPEDLDLYFIQEFDTALKTKGLLSTTMERFVDHGYPTLSSMRLKMSHHDTSEVAKSLSLKVASKIGAELSGESSGKSSTVVNLTHEINVKFHPREAFEHIGAVEFTERAPSVFLEEIVASTERTLAARDPATYLGNVGELSILLVGDVGTGKSSLVRSLIHAQSGVMGEPRTVPKGMILRTDDDKEGTQFVQQYELLQAPFKVLHGGSSTGFISMSDTEGMGLGTRELHGMSEKEVVQRIRNWTQAEAVAEGSMPTPKVVPNATWLVFDGHKLIKGLYGEAEKDEDVDEALARVRQATEDFEGRLEAYAGFLHRFRAETIPVHPLFIVFTKRDCIERDFPGKDSEDRLDELFAYTADTFNKIAPGAISNIFCVANYVPHDNEPGTSVTKLKAFEELRASLMTSERARIKWEARCVGWKAQNDALLRVVRATVEKVRARTEDGLRTRGIAKAVDATCTVQ